MAKKLVGAAVCVAALVVPATSAFAGERTGTGQPTPAADNAKSRCAFSGLEDFDFVSPVSPGVTQNWGQNVRVAGPSGGANDVGGVDGCNPLLYPNK
jgi:hypothetical protein